MVFRPLPSRHAYHRLRHAAIALLVCPFSIGVGIGGAVGAEPLAEIGSSFDDAGRALNRQLGDWFGETPKPKAPAARRAMPARVPLPPTRPSDAAKADGGAPAAESVPAQPATDRNSADEAQPAPEGAATAPAAAASAPSDVPTREATPAPEGAVAARATERPPAVSAPPPAPLRVEAAIPLPLPRPTALPPPSASDSAQLAALPPAAPPASEGAAPIVSSVPTICPELSNEDLGTFEPTVVTATNALCTVDRGVTLFAVRMKDGRLVKLQPAAVLRCEMAASVAHWLREEVDPAVATLGAPLDQVLVAASQQCRPRNRVAGARISEHGRGNAMDTRGFQLADGRVFVIGAGKGKEESMPPAFQEKLKASACADFTTILGPGSDGFHEQHLHVDRAVRRSGAVLCQWTTTAAKGASETGAP